MSKNSLIVGGTFDSATGKPSTIVTKLSGALGWDVINGGHRGAWLPDFGEKFGTF